MRIRPARSRRKRQADPVAQIKLDLWRAWRPHTAEPWAWKFPATIFGTFGTGFGALSLAVGGDPVFAASGFALITGVGAAMSRWLERLPNSNKVGELVSGAAVGRPVKVTDDGMADLHERVAVRLADLAELAELTGNTRLLGDVAQLAHAVCELDDTEAIQLEATLTELYREHHRAAVDATATQLGPVTEMADALLAGAHETLRAAGLDPDEQTRQAEQTLDSVRDGNHGHYTIAARLDGTAAATHQEAAHLAHLLSTLAHWEARLDGPSRFLTRTSQSRLSWLKTIEQNKYGNAFRNDAWNCKPHKDPGSSEYARTPARHPSAKAAHDAAQLASSTTRTVLTAFALLADRKLPAAALRSAQQMLEQARARREATDVFADVVTLPTRGRTNRPSASPTALPAPTAPAAPPAGSTQHTADTPQRTQAANG